MITFQKKLFFLVSGRRFSFLLICQISICRIILNKITGSIEVSGWTTLFIFQLFSFGVIMMTLGILGEYLWRCFDASRNRPPFIIEDEYQADGQKDDHNTENG